MPAARLQRGVWRTRCCLHSKRKKKSARGKREPNLKQCPVCKQEYPKSKIEAHIVICKKRAERAAQRAQRGEESDSEESSSDEEDFREECQFCNRKFNPDRIAKHEQICAKNATRKKRKEFKSARDARLENTDFEAYKENQRVVEKRPSRWRQRHEDFVGTVREGRLVSKFKELEIPLSELPPPGTELEKYLKAMENGSDARSAAAAGAVSSVPDGFVPCPHCGRTFAPERAEKHIPKCKTTKNRPKRLVRKSQVVLEKKRESPYMAQVIEAIKCVLGQGKFYSPLTENKEASMFRLDDRVVLADGRLGSVRFNGRVEGLNSGFWLGIEVDEQFEGRNDGYVDGFMIFGCKSGKGVFVRPSKVKKHVPKIEIPKKETQNPAAKKSSARRNSAEKLRDEVKAAKKLQKKAESPESDEQHQATTPEPAAEKPPKPTPRDENAARVNQKKKTKPAPKGSVSIPEKPAVQKKKKSKREALTGDAKKAYDKSIAKDVAFLQQLHGKRGAMGSPRGASPRSTESPKPKRIISCGGGQRLGGTGSAVKKASTKPNGRSAAAAQRAAFFEKKFGKS